MAQPRHRADPALFDRGACGRALQELLILPGRPVTPGTAVREAQTRNGHMVPLRHHADPALSDGGHAAGRSRNGRPPACAPWWTVWSLIQDRPWPAGPRTREKAEALTGDNRRSREETHRTEQDARRTGASRDPVLETVTNLTAVSPTPICGVKKSNSPHACCVI